MTASVICCADSAVVGTPVTVICGDDPVTIVRAKCFSAAAEALSVTRAVNRNAPALMGVPLMMPVEAFNLTPPGKAPALTDHVYGSVPPVAVSVCE